MPTILYQEQNINADMDALNNEDPNASAIAGAFGILALAPETIYTAFVIPRSQNVTGYTFELAYYPDLAIGLAPSQEMWGWSSPDREEVVLPGGANPQVAQRLGGRYFQIEVPSGQRWGYVRISELTGQGNPGVDLVVWRSD